MKNKKIVDFASIIELVMLNYVKYKKDLVKYSKEYQSYAVPQSKLIKGSDSFLDEFYSFYYKMDEIADKTKKLLLEGRRCGWAKHVAYSDYICIGIYKSNWEFDEENREYFYQDLNASDFLLKYSTINNRLEVIEGSGTRVKLH